ncbi:hypothetical protein ROSI111154_25055 [Rouxiella silvae]
MTRLTQAFEQVTYGDTAQNAALDMAPLISAEALKRVEDSDCAGQWQRIRPYFGIYTQNINTAMIALKKLKFGET